MADYNARAITLNLDRDSAGGGTVFARLVVGSTRDQTTPVLSNFSPAEGALLGKNDPVSFRVTDVLDGDEIVFVVQVAVYLVSTDTTELAYGGDGFENKYSTSTRVAYSTNGYTFTLRRRGGWPTGGIRVKVRVVDRGGNVGTL